MPPLRWGRTWLPCVPRYPARRVCAAVAVGAAGGCAPDALEEGTPFLRWLGESPSLASPAHPPASPLRQPAWPRRDQWASSVYSASEEQLNSQSIRSSLQTAGLEVLGVRRLLRVTSRRRGSWEVCPGLARGGEVGPSWGCGAASSSPPKPRLPAQAPGLGGGGSHPPCPDPGSGVSASSHQGGSGLRGAMGKSSGWFPEASARVGIDLTG